MTTVLDENVHNFAVDGTSDDLDVPIKERLRRQLSSPHCSTDFSGVVLDSPLHHSVYVLPLSLSLLFYPCLCLFLFYVCNPSPSCFVSCTPLLYIAFYLFSSLLSLLSFFLIFVLASCVVLLLTIFFSLPAICE
jgi:hypothetical protein